ncbi:MAG: phage holin family protein, partial [Achromobacter spanius]
MALILVWILNAVALLAVAYLLPGIVVASFGSALIAALVLGLVNMLVKPVLVLLTLPITIVTLGLFLI